MTDNNHILNQLDASPTKKFFVEMLTRDIEIEDAILDLLDNCVDGIQRIANNNNEHHQPYKGFWAKLTLSSDHFIIEDNCGGIPKDIAESYAFRMGRPNNNIDNDVYTIGTYGIGMKRAIFKMGRSSEIVSQTNNESFTVKIHPEWLIDDNDWHLPLEFTDPILEQSGTLIKVTNLYSHIQQGFSPLQSTVVNSLVNKIAYNYSYIIDKGFSIIVNGKKVTSQPFNLLWEGTDKISERETIAPYLYKYDKDGIEIKIAVGFYRGTASQTEVDEEMEGNRKSSEKAGWTIVCNDRVILYCDKTRLTGWGEEKVPSYHPQFIAISGIVYFRSKDTKKLPITSTKRGIDASSDIYLYIKNYMREGMKLFTAYTNKWKENLPQEKKISAKATEVDPIEIFTTIPDNLWKPVKGRNYEKKYSPKLPMPPAKNSTIKRKNIKFARPIQEIQIVAEYLFEDADREASDVGDECFEKVLKEANE